MIKRLFSLFLVLLLALSLFTTAEADDVPVNDEGIDLAAIDQALTDAAYPEYLLDQQNSVSPFGIAVRDLSADGENAKEYIIHLYPGQFGTQYNSNNKLFLKYCLEETGYFTISFEQPGTYTFRVIDLDPQNNSSTFGGTLIAGGGGGGGASVEVNGQSCHRVGDGGSGGSIYIQDWYEFRTGWKLTDFLSAQTVTVGKGGTPGEAFYYCTCGGEKCPIGGRKEFPITSTANNGKAGGDTVFHGITVKGGKAGLGSTTRRPGAYIPAFAQDGSDGQNAGSYYFWGVFYPNCGCGAGGGSFGANDGLGGDPIYFHDPSDLSFGRSGFTYGGRGNGGGGSGMSFSFAHPMYTGQGTGDGGGSYSHTVEGTIAKGGDSPSYNGYIYLEGKVKVESRKKIYNRFNLYAKVYPIELNPIPEISWASSSTRTGKVYPNGVVEVYKTNESFTVTATATKYGVQGAYDVEGYGTMDISIRPDTSDLQDEKIKVNSVFAMIATVNQNGQQLTVMHKPAVADTSQTGNDNQMLTMDIGTDAAEAGENAVYVYWYSMNSAVASIDSTTGIVTVLKKGIAVITATLENGQTAAYALEIS